MRRYANSVYAVALCVSVCLSVCHKSVFLKRLNVGSLKQRRTIAYGIYFFYAKNPDEIRMVLQPKRGRQIHGVG